MTLTAALFAGGESRRMGTDKAALVVAGTPLWQRQSGLLRELRPEFLWLSARGQPAWCPPEIEVVTDAAPAGGPLSGLVAVLRRLETSHLFALAIDLPRMTAEQLRKLWAMAQPGCGVVPVNGRLFEPLCAVYPREALAAAEEALARGDLALQNLTRVLRQRNLTRTHDLAATEKPLFHNLNTPADLGNAGAFRPVD